jgi:hypothetical protein
MGSRAQVKIQDTGVFLYTHWGASEIVEDVRTAIKRGKRLNDPGYLTRIIFDQMTLGQQGDDTGAGIGTQEAGDIEKLVTVDIERKAITIKDVYSGSTRTLSFTEFAQGEDQ